MIDSLIALCRKEPEWASSRIHTLEQERDAAIERAEKAEAEVERWKHVFVQVFERYVVGSNLLSRDAYEQFMESRGDLDKLERALGISHEDEEKKDECPGTGWYRCKECVHFKP